MRERLERGAIVAGAGDRAAAPWDAPSRRMRDDQVHALVLLEAAEVGEDRLGGALAPAFGV